MGYVLTGQRVASNDATDSSPVVDDKKVVVRVVWVVDVVNDGGWMSSLVLQG